jgi:hypothetical protein
VYNIKFQSISLNGITLKLFQAGQCRYKKKQNSGVKVTGFVDIPIGDENALTQAVNLA